jgi:hypothetical protein
LKKHLIIGIGILFLLGCAKSPFSTRDTEPPLGSGGTWETPHSPELVITNLFNSYNERIISNYQLCLSDSFVFSSPEDSIDAVNNGRPDLFIEWGKQTEVSATTNIFTTFSSSDTMKLFLFLFPASDHNDLLEDSLAVIYRNYSVLVVMTHAGVPDTITASGLATFHLYQEALNWWTIRWWEDLPAHSGTLDWADFKAEYR